MQFSKKKKKMLIKLKTLSIALVEIDKIVWGHCLFGPYSKCEQKNTESNDKEILGFFYKGAVSAFYS